MITKKHIKGLKKYLDFVGNYDYDQQIPDEGEILAEQAIELLDHITAVHKFDPNDESTWPEEGMYVVGYDGSQIETFIRIGNHMVYAINAGMDAQSVNRHKDDVSANNLIEIWGYSAPVLQAHLKSLKNID